jgi:hypothetical protein
VLSNIYVRMALLLYLSMGGLGLVAPSLIRTFARGSASVKSQRVGVRKLSDWMVERGEFELSGDFISGQ